MNRRKKKLGMDAYVSRSTTATTTTTEDNNIAASPSSTAFAKTFAKYVEEEEQNMNRTITESLPLALPQQQAVVEAPPLLFTCPTLPTLRKSSPVGQILLLWTILKNFCVRFRWSWWRTPSWTARATRTSAALLKLGLPTTALPQLRDVLFVEETWHRIVLLPV